MLPTAFSMASRPLNTPSGSTKSAFCVKNAADLRNLWSEVAANGVAGRGCADRIAKTASRLSSEGLLRDLDDKRCSQAQHGADKTVRTGPADWIRYSTGGKVVWAALRPPRRKPLNSERKRSQPGQVGRSMPARVVLCKVHQRTGADGMRPRTRWCNRTEVIFQGAACGRIADPQGPDFR